MQAASLLKWFFKMRTLFFYFSFLRNVNLKWIISTNDIAHKEKKMNFSKIKNECQFVSVTVSDV